MKIINFSKHPVISAFISALVALPTVFAFYFILEPVVVSSQSSSEFFVVTQEIECEVSFVTAPESFTLSPAISGLTGGTSNGSTTFSINANSPSGYRVEIEFDNAISAMRAAVGTSTIGNLGGTPEFNFNITASNTPARFGYTVEGPRVVNNLLDNGSACGSGSASAEHCWMLSENPQNIISGPGTADEEEHALHFRVSVPPNPSPQLESGLYHATATLTAFEL